MVWNPAGASIVSDVLAIVWDRSACDHLLLLIPLHSRVTDQSCLRLYVSGILVNETLGRVLTEVHMGLVMAQSRDVGVGVGSKNGLAGSVEFQIRLDMRLVVLH